MERSYTVKTRKELAGRKFPAKAQMLSELAAFAFSAGTLKLGRGKLSLVLSSELEEVITRYAAMLKRLYGSLVEIRTVHRLQPRPRDVFSIELQPLRPEGKLLFDIGLLRGSPEDYSFADINTNLFAGDEHFASCVRGAFLGCGILTDPAKDYRLEFVLTQEEFAAYLLEAFCARGLACTRRERKDRVVLYLTQMDHVSDLLTLIGATNAMMDLENVRVGKDVINQLNRSNNCLYGNMKKTISASQRQVEMIQAVLSSDQHLSDALREACELRLDHPDATLSELSEISGTVSKSALNKRFIKIAEIYEKL